MAQRPKYHVASQIPLLQTHSRIVHLQPLTHPRAPCRAHLAGETRPLP